MVDHKIISKIIGCGGWEIDLKRGRCLIWAVGHQLAGENKLTRWEITPIREERRKGVGRRGEKG